MGSKWNLAHVSELVTRLGRTPLRSLHRFINRPVSSIRGVIHHLVWYKKKPINLNRDSRLLLVVFVWQGGAKEAVKGILTTCMKKSLLHPSIPFVLGVNHNYSPRRPFGWHERLMSASQLKRFES